MNPQIWGQIVGITAAVITALSYQVNTKRNLLLIASAGTTCTCLAYLLLGAMPGFALNIVCLIRNALFYRLKEGTTPHKIATGLLMVAMCAVGALSWQGPVSLLIIIALAINTFFLSLGKPQVLRWSLLLTCTMIVIYNVAVFSLGGILNESISIVSSVIGIARFAKSTDKPENQEVNP